MTDVYWFPFLIFGLTYGRTIIGRNYASIIKIISYSYHIFLFKFVYILRRDTSISFPTYISEYNHIDIHVCICSSKALGKSPSINNADALFTDATILLLTILIQRFSDPISVLISAITIKSIFHCKLQIVFSYIYYVIV